MLHEKPWVNFEVNRNQALELAKDKGDYLLFIDADEELIFSEDFKKPALEKDFYYVPVKHQGSEELRILMINNHLPWEWKGVIHETLVCDPKRTFAPLLGVFNSGEPRDGHRSLDPDKYLKDAHTLAKALESEPDNARYLTFLGQCYMNAKHYREARAAFEKRLDLGGWDQELFLSLYNIGQIDELENRDFKTILDSYTRAFLFRPKRAEPLFRLACCCYAEENYILGYIIAQFARTLPMPQENLVVDCKVYHYLLPFIMANCAHKLGKNQEAVEIYKSILSSPALPSDIAEECTHNLHVMRQLMSSSL